MRGVLSAKVPNSSFAEAHKVLLSEPTDMEDEDEDQENEKEDERDGEECRVEGRRVSRQPQHADDTWMTCANNTVSFPDILTAYNEMHNRGIYVARLLDQIDVISMGLSQN